MARVGDVTHHRVIVIAIEIPVLVLGVLQQVAAALGHTGWYTGLLQVRHALPVELRRRDAQAPEALLQAVQQREDGPA